MKEDTSLEKNRGGRPTKRPQGEVLELLYQKHTAAEIAYLYDVPVGTVRSWIHYYRKDKKK